MITTYKVCSKCKLSKPLTDYYNNAAHLKYGSRDGKQPYCKECDNAKRMARYEEHRDQELVRAAAHRALVGKEYYANKHAEWQNANRDKYNAYMRSWRKKHKKNHALQGV